MKRIIATIMVALLVLGTGSMEAKAYDVHSYKSAQDFADDKYEEFYDYEDDYEDEDEAYDAAEDYWNDFFGNGGL